MLALLGLLGITFTGVGMFLSGDDDDAPETNDSNTTPDAELESEAAKSGSQDILSDFERQPVAPAAENEAPVEQVIDAPSAPEPAQSPAVAQTPAEAQTPAAAPDAIPDIAAPELSDLPAPSADANKIFGTDQTELLFGNGNADWIRAGAGNDRVLGGGGADRLEGGDGNDEMIGGDGSDKMFGQEGNDYLHGGTGDDLLVGGAGGDQLIGGDGNDLAFGGDGDDQISGGGGKDTLYGGAGDDVISSVERGEQAADFVHGGDGDDTLLGGDGDHLVGGTGEDTFIVQSQHGTVKVADFDPDLDRIEIVYVGLDQPVLTKLLHDGGTTVLADGRPVAEIQGASDVDLTKVGFVQH